ncbi:hypothetical protein [Lacisediminihabitans profunda]|uniref:Uncharacterized protein n=1 Tax=Lacisediminihabitans profunda TaxID=2594790 RepID=A0A5C8UQP2_9MICO|nr:hypothetical protein [Lacisediminihabitans profunda]TXN29767.1 hypothetical protein FVP33_11495 [Lacisediminihabitans profunda]
MTAAVAVGGLVIAATNTWTAISDVRASRFLGRAKGLLELRDLVVVEGPLQGSHVSENADKAHADLVLELEQESRANAVLYLDAAARLARPGSMLTGAGELVYGALLIWLAARDFPWSSSTADARAIPAIIVSAVLALIALIVVGVGIRQIVRRLKTRRLRKRVGALDDLTVEGSAWIKEVPGAVARKLRRR